MKYKAAIALALPFSLLIMLSGDFLIGSLPEIKGYSLSPLSSVFREEGAVKINLNFASSLPWRQNIPEYEVREIFESGETEIIFRNVDSVEARFDYAELADDPLIEELNYRQRNKDLVVEIKRKGAFLPASLTQDGSFAIIRLEEGDENYPSVFNQKPADNSAAYPILRKIVFQAELKAPLRKASVLFQGEPAEFSATEITKNKYLFEFKKEIQKDKQYWVKAIIADQQNRTTVNAWTFQGQIPMEAALGPDRFKYLGWWGQINADGVSIRQKPDRESNKLDTFSSSNRVKVLKEVIGENINDSNLWYQIDGGQYPGAYVFSEYVMPMIQPEAPKEFTIPREIKNGERWINVDLTKKILTLFDYDKPIFATYISSGREENPTATGTYRIWAKLRQTRMKGGPPLHDYIYDLPGVPNVLYYNESYAIHGTYWHDKFGAAQSAGCTNLTQGDADFIFNKTDPPLKPDQGAKLSSDGDPGTVVYNHY